MDESLKKHVWEKNMSSFKRKMSFWEIFDFECIYKARLGCILSLKSLQTFVIISDDMSVYLLQLYSNTNPVTHYTSPCPPRHSLFQLLWSKKIKLTLTIFYSNKVLMSFHHDAPNSHVPAINLLEFLVHALSITSCHSR